MEEDWDSWAKIIRSTILSSKEPLTVYEVNRDTKLIEGEDIPYRKFQFRTLEECLKSVPGLNVFQRNGRTVCQAIPTEASAHISRMIRAQKPAKKKARTMAPRSAGRFSSYSNYRRPPSYRPNNVPQNKYNPPRSSVPNTSNNYSRPSSAEPAKKPPTWPPPLMTSHSMPTTSDRKSPTSNVEQTRKSPQSVRSTTPAAATNKTTAPSSQKNVRFESPSTTQQKSASQQSSMQQRLSQPDPVVQERFVQPQQSSMQQRLGMQPPQQQPAKPIPQQQQQQPSSSIQQRLAQTQINPVQQRVSATQSSPQPKLATTQPTTQQPPVKPVPLAQRLNVAQSRQVPSPTNDPRLVLMSYTEHRGLPLPVYKDLPTKSQLIYSSVTVNSKKYSSYPKEAKTKEDAEKLAAEVALNGLLKDNKPKITTMNIDLITKRVVGIVNEHSNGLFESSLVDLYVAKYNEDLPPNWLKIVERSLIVDVGANDLTILSPQQKDAAYKRPNSPIASTEPPQINLSAIPEFWLHVYVAYNPADIWGVIIDEEFSDKLSELAVEMKAHYETASPKPLTVIPNKHYAIFDSEWHRVRCIKTDKEVATVFFIDRGDEDVFQISQFRELHPKFCQLPAQAVQLAIDGLEDLYACDEMQDVLEELIVDQDVAVEVTGITGTYAGVTLAQLRIEKDGIYDVKNLLMQHFLTKIVDPRGFMNTNKKAQEVYISSVTEKAIYIQLHSTGLKLLNTLITNLTKDMEKTNLIPKKVMRFDVTTIYLTKCNEDNTWRRVKLINADNEYEGQFICIDSGNTFHAKKNDLIILKELSELLAVYPPQAMEVRLRKISPLDFDKRMADHLRELAPKNEVFYMKVMGEMQDCPCVEFYKRTENNYLASLNDTLALEPEITSKDDNNNAKPRLRNDRSSFGSLGGRSEFPLKSPFVPPVGSEFDVHVTMAAHPGNFTVQPLKTAKALEDLMNELSRVCNSYMGPILTSANVRVGNMYAAKYDDGRWYRAYVSKVLGQSICAVYFCDYGDYRAVSLDHLQPLQNQFYDLPYQAIKAKLAGVIPKHKGDWTVKDSLRFNELTVTRSFVSIVKSCDIDSMKTGETILGLELIDTSTVDDIYISNVLVEEKRAERTEELLKI